MWPSLPRYNARDTKLSTPLHFPSPARVAAHSGGPLRGSAPRVWTCGEKPKTSGNPATKRAVFDHITNGGQSFCPVSQSTIESETMQTELTTDQVQTVQTVLSQASRGPNADDIAQDAWEILLRRQSTPWDDPDRLRRFAAMACKEAAGKQARKRRIDGAIVTQSLEYDALDNRPRLTAERYAMLCEALPVVPSPRSDDETLSDSAKLRVAVRTIRRLRKVRRTSGAEWYKLVRRIAVQHAIATGETPTAELAESVAVQRELETLASA